MNKQEAKEVIDYIFDAAFSNKVLSDQICLGIRHGIWGRNASDDASIDDTITPISEGLDNIAESIRYLADAISNTK